MEDLARVIGGSLYGLILLWFVLMMCVSASMPFVFFSVVRNITRSRAALERIAEQLESRGPRSGAGGLLGL